MKKFFKIPFKPKEVAILGHTAIIEAENVEDAYHILENIINNGEDPYMSNFECVQNDVIEIIDTISYALYSDGMV